MAPILVIVVGKVRPALGISLIREGFKKCRNLNLRGVCECNYLNEEEQIFFSWHYLIKNPPLIQNFWSHVSLSSVWHVSSRPGVKYSAHVSLFTVRHVDTTWHEVRLRSGKEHSPNWHLDPMRMSLLSQCHEVTPPLLSHCCPRRKSQNKLGSTRI